MKPRRRASAAAGAFCVEGSAFSASVLRAGSALWLHENFVRPSGNPAAHMVQWLQLKGPQYGSIPAGRALRFGE
ncbi:hypothetical protein DPQ25_04790 [Hydrogeniiclostridium mannosilyticum]|uniref:Uncharacterized protein n=1 Tax=Hydrogeniiclostridium mannosilyticum TaxID=2764322 RepID=A0A328UDF5_9FIRM|nr:hypothetical protein DPQ25_04790 [Hydrogeniiclostridium mannosilyticum]